MKNSLQNMIFTLVAQDRLKTSHHTKAEAWSTCTSKLNQDELEANTFANKWCNK